MGTLITIILASAVGLGWYLGAPGVSMPYWLMSVFLIGCVVAGELIARVVDRRIERRRVAMRNHWNSPT